MIFFFLSFAFKFSSISTQFKNKIECYLREGDNNQCHFKDFLFNREEGFFFSDLQLSPNRLSKLLRSLKFTKLPDPGRIGLIYLPWNDSTVWSR